MNEFEGTFNEVKAIIRNNETTLSPETIAICQEALRKCKDEYKDGYTNRETWVVALWLNNTPHPYYFFKDMADSLLDHEYPEEVLAEEIEKCLDFEWERLEIENGMLNDLFGVAKGRINFYEVAKTFLEE